MEFTQAPEKKFLDPEIKGNIMGAIDIARESPDFSLHAMYLTGDPEAASILMQAAISKFEQVIDADPNFVEWAYRENEKLDGARYPFHRGSIHGYEIALYQSMLLLYFTSEGGPLAQLPQEIIDDIIYSGITHETGLPEGRAGHEKCGADKVRAQSPQRPLRAFGIEATTVAGAEVPDAKGRNKIALVQKEVWEHKATLEKFDIVLQNYKLEPPLTQEQKELLLGIIVYPDVKGLIIPSATTETGVIASALENILTLPGKPLPLDIIKSFDGAVGGTAMLTEGIHETMRKTPIYERLLKEFKIPGSTDSKVLRFVMDNQPFYSNFFKSIQASIPHYPAPTHTNLEATLPGIPRWYPYLEKTIEGFDTSPSIQESNTLVTEFYKVLKLSLTFEHLIDNLDPLQYKQIRETAQLQYEKFLLDISNPALSYSQIEQSFKTHMKKVQTFLA